MPSNVTLGFNFDSTPARGSLSAFSSALTRALSGVEKDTAKIKAALDGMVSQDLANRITAIADAFAKVKDINVSQDSASALTTIAAAVARLDKSTGNGAAALESLRQTLSNMPSDVSKVSDGINGVVAAFGGLESVRADSVKAMASVMAATAKLAEQQKSVSPALSAMRQSLNSLFRDITRAQVPTEKLETIAAFTRAMRGIATANAGVNISSSFASIGNSIINLRDALQNFSVTDEQASSLAALARLAKSMSGFDASSAQNASLLGSAMQYIGAAASGMSIDLAQVNTVVLLAKAVKAIPADAPAKGEAVAGLFAALANAAPAASNLSRAASELASLGAAIRRIPSGNAAVANIAKLFDVLQGLEARFRSLNLSGTADQFTLLGQSLRGLKVSKANANNLEKVINLLAGFRPLPPESLSSIRTLTDLLQALGHAAVGSTSAMREHTMSLRQVRNEMTGTTMLVQGFTSVLSTQFLKEAAQDAAAFGRELAFINTIAKEFRNADLGAAFKSMASYLGTAQGLANSFYYAYSSGVRGSQEQLMAFTAEMANLSQLIRADVTPTVNAVTGVMNAYGLGVQEADRVSRMLFNTIKYGKALGGELANSLGMVTPSAAIAKIPIEELGAALASLTRVMPTANAITALNNLITKIIRPTSDAAKMAKMYGVELSLAAVQSDGLLGTLRKLHDALGDNQDAIARIFPDIRGIRAAFQLLGNGFDEFESFTEMFKQDSKSVSDATEELRGSVEYQLGALPESFRRIRLEAGQMLISLLEPAAPLLRMFNEMSETWRKSLALVGALTAGYSAIRVGMIALDAINRRTMEAEAQRHSLAMQRIADSQRVREELIRQVSVESNLSDQRRRLMLRDTAGDTLNPGEYSRLYLNGSADSGKAGAAVAALAAKRQELAQAAAAEADYQATLARTALAEGNSAQAAVYASQARRQYTRYLVLNAEAQRLQAATAKMQARAQAIEEKKLRLLNATMREQLGLRLEIGRLKLYNAITGTIVPAADALKGALATIGTAIAGFLKSVAVMAAWAAAFWAAAKAAEAIWKWIRRADEAAKALVEKMQKAAEQRAKWAEAERRAAETDRGLVENLLKFNGVELGPEQFSEFKFIINNLIRTYGEFGVVFDLVNNKFYIAEEGIKKLQNAIDTRSMKSLVDEVKEYADSANSLVERFTGLKSGIGDTPLSWENFQQQAASQMGTWKKRLALLEDEQELLIARYQQLASVKRIDKKLSEEEEEELIGLEAELEEWIELNDRLAKASGVELKAQFDAYIEFYDKWKAKNDELRTANAKRLLEENSATLELIKLREKEQELRREFTESLMTRPEQARYLQAQIGELERRAEAAQKTLAEAREGGDLNSINRAMNEEQKITNAIYERRVKLFNIQREMAKEQFQTQKQAYENTVKMVMEMDKFKARTANTFEVGTWEAVELMSRRFENLGALPEIKLPEDQTVSLAANPQLQELIDINTAIAAGLKGAEGKYIGNRLWLGEDFETDYIRNRNLSGKAPDNSAVSRESVGGALQLLIKELTKEVSNMETVGKQMQAIEPTVREIFSTPDADAFIEKLSHQFGIEIERRGVKLVVKPVGR